MQTELDSTQSIIYFTAPFFCLVPVQFAVLPQNVTVNETNPIVMSCDASGFPTPSLTWIKNGQVVSQLKQLNIQSSSRSDAGIYMCNASNGLGQDKTAKAYITVQCKHHAASHHDVILVADTIMTKAKIC